MPTDQVYAVGCLKTGSWPVTAKGRFAPPTLVPAGLSALPFSIVACGWNGGLPPSSVESFSVARLWKTPALARTMVAWLSE